MKVPAVFYETVEHRLAEAKRVLPMLNNVILQMGQVQALVDDVWQIYMKYVKIHEDMTMLLQHIEPDPTMSTEAWLASNPNPNTMYRQLNDIDFIDPTTGKAVFRVRGDAVTCEGSG